MKLFYKSNFNFNNKYKIIILILITIIKFYKLKCNLIKQMNMLNIYKKFIYPKINKKDNIFMIFLSNYQFKTMIFR